MNKVHGLTAENLLAVLPPVLAADESMVALAAGIAEVLAGRVSEIERLNIYSRIDELPEDLLDILAYDFKVDWWDADYTLEEKRRTLKDSWRVHRMLGTKAAVETAISAIYPYTKVLEWFEYGGEPYHFRLDINITDDQIDSNKQRRVLERLNYYKSLRSHNDGVTYFVEAAPAVAKAASGISGLTEAAHISLELKPPIIKPTVKARVGSVTALWESTTVCMNLDTPAVQRVTAARAGGVTGLYEIFQTSAVLPDGGQIKSTAQLRTAVRGAWQECYVTEAVPFEDKVLTAAARTSAKGVVASTQETAKTHIKF